MTDYRMQPSHDCYPTDNPADQPKPPKCECSDLPGTTPPVLKDPPRCPDPPDKCKCPPPPTTTTNCLERAIDKQAKRAAIADKAKAFQTELEQLLTSAKAAAQAYTTEKYTSLLKLWQEEDRNIVELVRKLVCAVPCWECVIECYVCPLLNAMHDAEQRLCGDGTLYSEVHNLYDLRYWLDRDSAAKQARLLGIKGVLTAWGAPAQTIEKILTVDNKKLIDDCNKALGTEPGKVIFDVFLKLIPMHLAIAPPKTDAATTTGIDKKYTKFCGCDTGNPDDCCGPDVGKLILRQRILGPQPYLVKPSEYFSIICCLVEKRYHPAKDAATDAEAALAAIDAEIARRKNQLDNGLKSFLADARSAVPSDPDCFDCGEDSHQQMR